MNDHFADHIFRYFTLTLVNNPAGGSTTIPGTASWCPPDRNSFGYWYDANTYPFDGKTALNGFDSNLHFYFVFQVTDPLFYSYTNLQSLPPTMDATKLVNNEVQLNYYFFANHLENLDAKNNGLSGSLAKKAKVSTADTLIGQPFYTNNNIASLSDTINVPFALISVIWNAQLWQNNLVSAPDPANTGQTIKIYKPPEYQVYFPNK
jgi:hypothetical protein